MFVLGAAGVHTAVKAARLADLQRADALVVDLPELGVVTDDHLVLHPDNLRLRREKFPGYFHSLVIVWVFTQSTLGRQQKMFQCFRVINLLKERVQRQQKL